MKLSRCQRVGRWLTICLLVSTGGGATFVFESCDPTVSSSLLAGFNDFAVALIDTLFIAIEAQQETDTGSTTTTTTS